MCSFMVAFHSCNHYHQWFCRCSIAKQRNAQVCGMTSFPSWQYHEQMPCPDCREVRKEEIAILLSGRKPKDDGDAARAMPDADVFPLVEDKRELTLPQVLTFIPDQRQTANTGQGVRHSAGNVAQVYSQVPQMTGVRPTTRPMAAQQNARSAFAPIPYGVPAPRPPARRGQDPMLDRAGYTTAPQAQTSRAALRMQGPQVTSITRRDQHEAEKTEYES